MATTPKIPLKIVATTEPIPARNPAEKGTQVWRERHYDLVEWLARWEGIMPATGSLAWEEIIDRRSDRMVEMFDHFAAEKRALYPLRSVSILRDFT